MARRAEAGAKVCFLYDGFGAREITPQVAETWRRRGIEMRDFCARASIVHQFPQPSQECDH